MVTIVLRRDIEAKWKAINPMLLEGELIYVKDKEYFKIGDGIRPFNELKVWNEAIPFEGSMICERGVQYSIKKHNET